MYIPGVVQSQAVKNNDGNDGPVSSHDQDIEVPPQTSEMPIRFSDDNWDEIPQQEFSSPPPQSPTTKNSYDDNKSFMPSLDSGISGPDPTITRKCKAQACSPIRDTLEIEDSSDDGDLPAALLVAATKQGPKQPHKGTVGKEGVEKRLSPEELCTSSIFIF